MDHNVINDPGLNEGIIASGGFITNNRIELDSWVDAVSLSGSYFVGNIIEGGGWDSVILTGSVTFMGNTVKDSVDIAVSLVPTVAFDRNFISNSKIGIEGSGFIDDSTITGNKIGVQVTDSGFPTIAYGNHHILLQHL